MHRAAVTIGQHAVGALVVLGVTSLFVLAVAGVWWTITVIAWIL